MSRSRATLAIGLAAAGGVGYYLYSAGGSPSAAGKKFESDAYHVADKVSAEAEQKGRQVDAKAEAFNKNVSKAKGEVDAAARKVEEDAAKGKSYLSSWFGSK
ncbi:hypothetical protein C8A05DRAFT_32283 [Staphylotrichum tortipilum]|uniref:Calcofluor white hypersensitive protein n=1 Tax=Staphylotrichum tortipilum TaxID=2831512 RepID=A0AAN6MN41_9PEZI|nr:hypothetical protein C8A05DRAFT_32283 [Staphylotrichum longicolle]